MTQPLHKELQELQHAFRKSELEVRQFLGAIPDELFNKKPESDRWSVAECIQHLIQTGEYVTEEIEKSIATGIRKNVTGYPPFTYGWFNRSFINYMKPNGSIKSPAPKIYKPDLHSVYNRTRILKNYSDLQSWYCELLERAHDLDLKHVKVRSPALPVLRLSLGAIFHAMAVHQERHIAQAKRTYRELQRFD